MVTIFGSLLLVVPEVLLHKNLSALFEAGGEFSGQLATYTQAVFTTIYR